MFPFASECFPSSTLERTRASFSFAVAVLTAQLSCINLCQARVQELTLCPKEIAGKVQEAKRS